MGPTGQATLEAVLGFIVALILAPGSGEGKGGDPRRWGATPPAPPGMPAPPPAGAASAQGLGRPPSGEPPKPLQEIGRHGHDRGRPKLLYPITDTSRTHDLPPRSARGRPKMSGSHWAQATGQDAPDTRREYLALIAGSADVNTVAGIDGIYRYVSPACRDHFGWDPAELEGRQRDDFVHPDDVSPIPVERPGSTASGKQNSTYRFLCRDGSYRWVEARSRTVDTREGTLMVSALRDITERHKSEANLQRQAFTDPLTGVANRTVLMDRLNQALRRQARGEGVLAVLYVDLDRFKIINDSLGHRTGDAVLLQMAERLTHHLRPADTLARLGCD